MANSPTAVLTEALGQSAINGTVGIAGGIDLDEVEPNTLAVVDGEWVQVTAVNLVGQTVTLARGLLDIVPVAHGVGARLWFVDGWRFYLTPEYVQHEIARVKLLPRTPKWTLAEAAATELNLTLAKRFIRPYRPGNVRVNGLRYPGVITGELSISWATRNRQSQTAYLVLQTERSITPEAGQTTTVRLFNVQKSFPLAHLLVNLHRQGRQSCERRATFEPATQHTELGRDQSGQTEGRSPQGILTFKPVILLDARTLLLAVGRKIEGPGRNAVSGKG